MDARFSNIGITHVFSCINICRVPRMLFEHEADRPSVQHHPRDPASVNAMKHTNRYTNRYLCISEGNFSFFRSVSESTASSY